MSGYRIGMAEEAVIADLTAKLAECQAREAKLREALRVIAEAGPADDMDGNYLFAEQALALPHDDTALKEYRKKVLLEAATKLEDNPGRFYFDGVDELRRMAEE